MPVPVPVSAGRAARCGGQGGDRGVRVVQDGSQQPAEVPGHLPDGAAVEEVRVVAPAQGEAASGFEHVEDQVGLYVLLR